MKWKKRFGGLYVRLRKELGNPREASFDKRILRKASDLGLSCDEALFILARERSLGYLRDFSRLSPEEKNHVNQAIKPTYANSAHGSSRLPKKVAGARQVVIKTGLGTIVDPYLPQRIIQEAKAASETAYPFLYIFENSLRNFINAALTKNFGSDWWVKQMKTKTLQKIQTVVAGRMKREQRDAYHGTRGSHPIYFSDFSHLADILGSFPGVFNPFFKNLTGGLNAITIKLREIEPSRNVTSHHNPLSKKDLNRVEGYLAFWLDQLKYIKGKNLL